MKYLNFPLIRILIACYHSSLLIQLQLTMPPPHHSNPSSEWVILCTFMLFSPPSSPCGAETSSHHPSSSSSPVIPSQWDQSCQSSSPRNSPRIHVDRSGTIHRTSAHRHCQSYASRMDTGHVSPSLATGELRHSMSAKRWLRSHLLFDSTSQVVPVVLLRSMPTVVLLRLEMTWIVSDWCW